MSREEEMQDYCGVMLEFSQWCQSRQLNFRQQIADMAREQMGRARRPLQMDDQRHKAKRGIGVLLARGDARRLFSTVKDAAAFLRVHHVSVYKAIQNKAPVKGWRCVRNDPRDHAHHSQHEPDRGQ